MNLHLKTTLVVGGCITSFILFIYLCSLLPLLTIIFVWTVVVFTCVSLISLLYVEVYRHLKDKQKWKKLNNE